LRLISISTGDLGTNLLATETVDKPFKTKPHRFRTTSDYASLHELIDRSRKFILHSSHQLSHAISITNCNASRNASLSLS